MNPVIIEDTIAIAANTVNPNVIVSNPSLRKYLRAPFNAAGKLVAVQSAAGLTIDLDYGSKNVVANTNPRVSATIEEPNDVLNDQFFPREGDQLVLRVANTTGGALNITYRIVLEPADQLMPDCRTMQQGPIQIAANAVDVQVLDGLRYERPPVPSTLDVFMSASAAGLTRRLDVDTESISPPAAVNPTNRIPMDPFDGTIEDIEVEEDKLISLAITNTTGGALNTFWKTKLTEYART